MQAKVVPRQLERCSRLLARLAAPGVLILDGAMGTELERRGLECALPLWSAEALIEDGDQIFDIHRAYVASGADLLTANTFRTQQRTLAKRGRGEQAAVLTASAIALARRAADGSDSTREVFVLGSAPPLEDCFRPDCVPDAAALANEHREHAANLFAAGADAILVETMNTIREANAAASAASETGLPVLVSFVCGADARLLSGEPLAEALAAVGVVRPSCVLVNCIAPARASACVETLRDFSSTLGSADGCTFGVYANVGYPDPREPVSRTERNEGQTPREFARLATQWARAGAKIVGGCCGTTPEHIAAMVASLRGE